MSAENAQQAQLKKPHLCLNFGNLAIRELKLVERHLGLLEHAQESQLFRQQEEQRATATVQTARGTTHTVDVLLERMEQNTDVNE